MYRKYDELQTLTSIVFALLLFMIGYTNGYFVKRQEEEISKDQNSELVKNIRLSYGNIDSSQTFPSEFYVSFSAFDKQFNEKFVLTPMHNEHSDEVYVIDPNTGNPVKYNWDSSTKIEEYQHYKQQNGLGYATLIRNHNSDDKNPFRIIGNIQDSDLNVHIDLTPVVVENGQMRRMRRSVDGEDESSFDWKSNHHIVSKRQLTDNSLPSDVDLDDLLEYIDIEIAKPVSTTTTTTTTKKSVKVKSSKSSKTSPSVRSTLSSKLVKYSKSSVGSAQVTPSPKLKDEKTQNRLQPKAPTVLTCRVFLVVDDSAFKNHARVANTTNKTSVYALMKVYYAYVIQGVNERYSNALQNDPDLRITIVFTKILFINAIDASWLSSTQISNGKEVVMDIQTLKGFIYYMNNTKFNFQYDAAIALFNKDIWYTNSPYSTPSLATGYSLIGQVCQLQRYAIAEDFGAMECTLTVAHELGHLFGMWHDGRGNNTCLAVDNHIMTPIVLMRQQANLFTLSDCSIKQLKDTLLVPGFTALNVANYSCLDKSLPISLEIIPSTVAQLPGLVWSPNDQCKYKFGDDASYCQNTSSVICSNLYCRRNSSDFSCSGVSGAPMEGTICEPGKLCRYGICIDDPSASTKECPFGDDKISINYQSLFTGISFPSSLINCSQLFGLIAAKNQSISGYCELKDVQKLCCQSCQKYRALTCKDILPTCSNYLNSCDGTFGAGPYDGLLISDVCPRSCGKCSKPQTCSTSSYLCLNGGTCRNTTTSTENGQFGYVCDCPPNYTGPLCENADPCVSNPCKNGGVCKVWQNTAGATDVSQYWCICPDSTTGSRCEWLNGVEITDPPTTAPATTVTTAGPGGSGASTVAQCVDNPNALLTCGALASQAMCLDPTKFIGDQLFSVACAGSCNEWTNACPATDASTTVVTSTAVGTTVTTAPKCVDVSPACADFKDYCLKNVFLKNLLIYQACPVTCNTCNYIDQFGSTLTTPPVTSVCADLQPNCGLWQDSCQILAGFSPHPCPKTCKICP